MSAPYQVRRYQGADFDSVAALAVYASSSPETACGQPDVASVNEFAADYGHRNLEAEGWVAETALGDVVAFAAGLIRGDTMIVDGPIVAAAWQRRGIGQALFSRLEDDALAAHCEVVEAGVRASNDRGRSFLDRLGYEAGREIFCYEAHRRVDLPIQMHTGYEIGDLKPRYLLPFLMIMHECFPGYRLPSNPQRLFEPDKMKIFLAIDAEDRPVGAATAFFYPEDHLGYIYHLGVSEPSRRRGLARALLNSACGWLWDLHQPSFIGLSTSDNQGVRTILYEPAGFDLRYALLYRRKAIAQQAKV